MKVLLENVRDKNKVCGPLSRFLCVEYSYCLVKSECEWDAFLSMVNMEANMPPGGPADSDSICHITTWGPST